MPKKLYSVFLTAKKITNTTTATAITAWATWAVSGEEAIGLGLEEARRVWPASGGYSAHQAGVQEVPSIMLSDSSIFLEHSICQPDSPNFNGKTLIKKKVPAH